MAPGRTGPWCCWEEWFMVKDWLLSESSAEIRKGIRRVEAWRARGRVPLGVDITASLLETALWDASFWGHAAATAAVSTPPGTSSGLSQQQIRLQYSATIVRMVNGIADSQQKGRVALSVTTLAESAGLSRLLVDIRHESTHGELPSLSTLQLAARQALDWLVNQYWVRQSEHLSACHTRVQDILSAIVSSCQAAANKSLTAAAAAADSEQEGEELQAAEGKGYTAAEGRKQRKQLLSELKTLLPPSHTPLLAALLMKGRALIAIEQQQQQQQGGDGPARKAQEAVLASLSKQYPDLKVHLLQEVVDKLCNLTAQQQQQSVDGLTEAQQQQQELSRSDICQEADSLVAWLQLLLPGAATCAGADVASSSSSRSAKQQQQQQQQQEWLDSIEPALLTNMLADILRRSTTMAAAAVQVDHPHHDPDHEQQQQQQVVLKALQQAQQLLLPAVAKALKPPPAAAAAAAGSKETGSGKGKDPAAMLQKLAQLSTPATTPAAAVSNLPAAGGHVTSSNLQQLHQQHAEWLQQQQALLMQSQQQQRRKRKHQEQDLVDVDRARAAAAAAAAGGESSSKRWKRAKRWTACPIGCLPGARQPRHLLSLLEAPDATPPLLERRSPAAAAGAAAAPLLGALAQQEQQQLQFLEAALMADAAAAAETDLVQDLSEPLTTAAAAAAAAAAIDADPGTSCDDDVLHFGRHWHMSRRELGQMQQSIKLLL